MCVSIKTVRQIIYFMHTYLHNFLILWQSPYKQRLFVKAEHNLGEEWWVEPTQELTNQTIVTGSNQTHGTTYFYIYTI